MTKRIEMAVVEPETTAALARFKAYAVSHQTLEQVDSMLMRAIREPAGFAHVLVYGPSGVGKSTMIRQIVRRLNGDLAVPPPQILGHPRASQHPLLVVETRPPDGGAFNRGEYYRSALKLLGEPFYERRTLVDIDAEAAWEKKGRGRSKAAHFNESPELRRALEDAMHRHGVRAVLLDEAQHLMKVGSGESSGKLLDQLDWIKSMSNVTGVVHILVGTYELLNLRNLSGQASRRSLDIHFPRYQLQHEPDRLGFQAVLLALLRHVPLTVAIEPLMQRWLSFYERCIGCIGVLKDWLVRAVATALYTGQTTLTWEWIEDHALSLAQCERMALEATEGEHTLRYTESRREQLWRLLNLGMPESPSPTPSVAPPPAAAAAAMDAPSGPDAPAKPARKPRQRTAPDAPAPIESQGEIPPAPSTRKRQSRTKATGGEDITTAPATPPKRQARKKAVAVNEDSPPVGHPPDDPLVPKRQTRKKKTSAAPTDHPTVAEVAAPRDPPRVPDEPARPATKRRVGQRKATRDRVGEEEDV